MLYTKILSTLRPNYSAAVTFIPVSQKDPCIIIAFGPVKTDHYYSLHSLDLSSFARPLSHLEHIMPLPATTISSQPAKFANCSRSQLTHELSNSSCPCTISPSSPRAKNSNRSPGTARPVLSGNVIICLTVNCRLRTAVLRYPIPTTMACVGA